MNERRLFVAGDWVATGDIHQVLSPHTGDVVARVHRAGPGDVEKAIASAVKAAPAMREMPAWKRAEILHSIARSIAELREELARSLAMELHAELPGLKPEDVHIRIENNLLTLKGERRIESREDKENYHRRERALGKFARTFTLPSPIAQEKISAEFTDGVLKVTLPKREEPKPKQISIKIK